ncbi:C-terminal processing peptidase-3, Serine peptidase, MEROPS family S41A [Desulforamulus reducens MI-1]|uniref:C-terminal processing peptidase-3, Serine peptidase, MEROPS family S41A n=1 Tax=Desulforamulus reducens (strain ATCC BAA-1160 / DSM 100696 / MI-1) TaxID=349161 RepID=A4J919_DESRM|nr:S41 family peptidase [Desulforamulus reducens]ABO51572.1 C-terminal processing peptidase-3, Serine peptidase, MEROPS family S41A [Desulforamulus reducens MI-1]
MKRDSLAFWGRLTIVLASVVFAILLLVGGTLAANYKGMGNLIKVVTLVKGQYLFEVTPEKLVEGAIKGVVESLNDPYSAYLDKKTYSALQEQIRGSFGGIGILVGMKDHYLTVVKPFPNTPAAEKDIRAGDIIIAIDDKQAKDMDTDTAVNLMRGPVGSKVELTILREGDEKPFPVQLTREEISVPTVEGRMVPDENNVGYIVIGQFTENTGEEMVRTIAELREQNMAGLVLDLRDNPGGELNSAIKVADQFLGKGPIVHIDYRIGKDYTFDAEPDQLNMPLVVLVNKGSASASEILAGAIKDAGVGTLVGTKTFGKGIVQTVFPLDNGAGLKLTTARYLTPNKNDIHKKGIAPHVVIEQEIHAKQDKQLETAIKIIRDKIHQ